MKRKVSEYENMSDKISLNTGSYYGTAGHNDRSKYKKGSKSEHIYQPYTGKNEHWDCLGLKSSVQAEIEMYEKYCRKYLEDTNERAIKTGHSERVKNMDKFMRMKKYAPRETIIQIGKSEDGSRFKGDWDKYMKCVKGMVLLYKNYLEELGITVLSYDIHWDETSPHAHIRFTPFTGDDKDPINMERLMREGIFNKDPLVYATAPWFPKKSVITAKEKKEHLLKKGNEIPDWLKDKRDDELVFKNQKSNSRWMVATALMRYQLIEYAEKSGFDIDKEVDKSGRKHMPVDQYRKYKAKLQEQEKAMKELNNELDQKNGLIDQINSKGKQLDNRRKTLEQLEENIEKNYKEFIGKVGKLLDDHSEPLKFNGVEITSKYLEESLDEVRNEKTLSIAERNEILRGLKIAEEAMNKGKVSDKDLEELLNTKQDIEIDMRKRQRYIDDYENEYGDKLGGVTDDGPEL